ncbi:MAG: amidohydrolase family protein, partial [Pseudomonadota bacterium]
MTMLLDRRQVMAGSAALLAASAAKAQGGDADLVLLNGKITTMDPAQPEASALAARDGVFVAVGSDDEMRGLIGPFTQVIDARGQRVIPGLIDSHTHAIRGAVNYNLEVRWDGVDSLEEALHLLRQQAERTPEGGADPGRPVHPRRRRLLGVPVQGEAPAHGGGARR